MSRLSRFLVLLECVFILVPLSLLAAIDSRIMLSSMSDGLVYATINPMGSVAMTVIAVSALLSAWVLSVKYITAGPLGLVQLGKWLESVLYIVVAIGGGAGGYAALRWVGSDLLYALGLGIFVPLCHLLVVRQLYVRSQKFMDA